MGLQKYRADRYVSQADGSDQWFTNWMGGSTLAKIGNCRIDGSELRRMVYITGEPCTYFSQPAACIVRRHVVRGYVTGADDGTGALIFHAMDSHKHLLQA